MTVAAPTAHQPNKSPKIVISKHAVERFISRLSPGMSHGAAQALLEDRARIAEHTNLRTERGQPLWKIVQPAAYLVVVPSSSRVFTIATVLTPQQINGNEISETEAGDFTQSDPTPENVKPGQAAGSIGGFDLEQLSALEARFVAMLGEADARDKTDERVEEIAKLTRDIAKIRSAKASRSIEKARGAVQQLVCGAAAGEDAAARPLEPIPDPVFSERALRRAQTALRKMLAKYGWFGEENQLARAAEQEISDYLRRRSAPPDPSENP